MNDLPSGQITHSTGYLNSHMYKVLLGNCLQEHRTTINAKVQAQCLWGSCFYCILVCAPHPCFSSWCFLVATDTTTHWKLMKNPYSILTFFFETCQGQMFPICNCLTATQLFLWLIVNVGKNGQFYPSYHTFFTVSLETNSFSGSRAQTAVKIVVAIYCWKLVPVCCSIYFYNFTVL